MADGTAEVARAIAQLTTALIEAATRISVAMIERRAQRLRETARRGEQAARQERARLSRHHAADAAIWRRTSKPDWWASARPEDISRAWRAVSTWHHADPEAAGVRQAMVERLRSRGVNIAQDVSANPGDVRWLQTALDLARAEREEQLAFRDDLDAGAELSDELMWDADELPRDDIAKQVSQAHSANERPKPQHPTLKRDEATAQAKSTNEKEPARKQQPVNGVSLVTAVTDAAEAAAADATEASRMQGAAENPTRQRRKALAEQTAVATQPDRPQRLGEQEMSRMAGMLRQAWSSEPQRAQRVLDDGAWPALASSMHRLEARGKDVSGLLSRLDASATDSTIPAVTTDWALRASAAGPVTHRRMVTSRHAHQVRLVVARQQAAQQLVAGSDLHGQSESGHGSVETDATAAARLLTAAYPQSTKTAVNRQRAVGPIAGERTTAKDRAKGQDKVPAPAER